MSIPEQPQALTLNTLFQLPLPNLLLEQIDWIVFSNNSPYVLEVVCGGLLFHVPAWYYYPFSFIDPGSKRRLGTTGTQVTVQPIQQTIPGSSFTSQLFYTIFLNNETPPLTIPTPLGGGPVDLTVASSIQNTNDPPGNTEVFLKPNGDNSTTGTVNIKNTGIVRLGDNSYAGEVDVFDVSGAESKLLGSILQFFDFSGFQTANLVGGPSTGITVGISFTANPGATVGLDSQNGLTLLSLGRVSGANPLNGSVSGSFSLWQPARGSLNILVAYWNNFNTAVDTAIALPTALSNGAIVLMGGGGPCVFQSGGVAQTVRAMTGLPTASAAGSQSALTNGILQGWTFGQIMTGFTTFVAKATGGSAFTGMLIIIGN